MTTGYRGKSTADSGYYYAPYIPEIPVTWRDYLDYYSRQSMLGTQSLEQKLNLDRTLAECAHEALQRRWPGPYQVEEYYNTSKGRFDFRLKFQDPQEEVIWLLRWA
jgi:hypothetical protein